MNHKLYFAKYLPVEGELSPGDMALKPAVPSAGIDEPYVEEIDEVDIERLKRGDEFLKGSKKAVLYICRREKDMGEFLGDSDVYLLMNPKNGIEAGPFKKILPVSPDAKWVEEWDQFDVKDLFFMKAQVAVKCPTCGTPH